MIFFDTNSPIDARVLGVSRGLNSKLFGLIGGKVEPNETYEEAGIREAKEECGLTVLRYQYVFSRYSKNFECRTFLALEYEGSLVPSDEGNLQWLSVPAICSKETSAYPDYNFECFKQIEELRIFIKHLYPNFVMPENFK